MAGISRWDSRNAGLAGAVAAIDCDRLAGHEGGEIGGKINGELAHLFELAGARDWMHLSLGFKRRLRISLDLRYFDRQRRFDITGTDGVDPYPLVGEIEGGGFDEADDSRFGGAVGGPFTLAN